MPPVGFEPTIPTSKRLRWSRGKRAGLWYPSSRVQTWPKPSDFSGEKLLSTPSFGGELKPSVSCRKFTACKRTQKRRGSRHFRQNSRKFLAHSSTFRCWGSLASFQAWGTPGGGSWNVLITSWGFDVSLATALCKKPSCWEYSTAVDQVKTHKGCSADWRIITVDEQQKSRKFSGFDGSRWSLEDLLLCLHAVW